MTITRCQWLLLAMPDLRPHAALFAADLAAALARFLGSHKCLPGGCRRSRDGAFRRLFPPQARTTNDTIAECRGEAGQGAFGGQAVVRTFGQRAWGVRREQEKPRLSQCRNSRGSPDSSGPRPERTGSRRGRRYTASGSSTCLASRLRATCRRRLMVPTGARNRAAISARLWPWT